MKPKENEQIRENVKMKRVKTNNNCHRELQKALNEETRHSGLSGSRARHGRPSSVLLYGNPACEPILRTVKSAVTNSL
jgi:hypothetical protein